MYNWKRVSRIAVSPASYFNQKLLKCSWHFASDADYIFFVRSVYEQHLLQLSINFAMCKIKPGTFTTETVKSDFKENSWKVCCKWQYIFIYEFIQRNTNIQGTVLYNILAKVKQLGMTTYFLSLSRPALRWEELPYFINKWNNLELSEEELINLSCQGRYNLLNNNPVLVARHFRYIAEILLKEIILIAH